MRVSLARMRFSDVWVPFVTLMFLLFSCTRKCGTHVHKHAITHFYPTLLGMLFVTHFLLALRFFTCVAHDERFLRSSHKLIWEHLSEIFNETSSRYFSLAATQKNETFELAEVVAPLYVCIRHVKISRTNGRPPHMTA